MQIGAHIYTKRFMLFVVVLVDDDVRTESIENNKKKEKTIQCKWSFRSQLPILMMLVVDYAALTIYDFEISRGTAI